MSVVNVNDFHLDDDLEMVETHYVDDDHDYKIFQIVSSDIFFAFPTFAIDHVDHYFHHLHVHGVFLFLLFSFPMVLKISLFTNQTSNKIYFCDHHVQIQLQVLDQVIDIDQGHEVLPLFKKKQSLHFPAALH